MMLQAADNLLLTREAVAGVARKAGLLASFLPKLAPDEAGSGAHCHISLHNVRATLPYRVFPDAAGLAGQPHRGSRAQSRGAPVW